MGAISTRNNFLISNVQYTNIIRTATRQQAATFQDTYCVLDQGMVKEASRPFASVTVERISESRLPTRNVLSNEALA